MPGTNQFLPFASGEGSNSLAYGDYADPQHAPYRERGNIAGIASSTLFNTTMRQASSMASAVGGFMAGALSEDILDNGDIGALTTQFARAVRASLGSGAPYYADDTSAVVDRVTIQLNEFANYPFSDILPRGTSFLVNVALDNGGPVTFRLNERRSIAVTYPDGRPLMKGALRKGAMVVLVATPGAQNGTTVVQTVQLLGVVSPAAATARVYFGRDSGTGNAFLVTPANINQPVAELGAGTFLILQPSHGNTGASTLDFVGLKTAPIVIGTGTALSGGELARGDLAFLAYDGASWQMKSGAGLYGSSGQPAVQRPTITSPANGATNVSSTATVVGSTYYALYGKPQGGMQLRIANDPDFTSIAYSGTQSGAGTSFPIPSGANLGSGTYFARIAYSNTDGVYSQESPTVQFSTSATANRVATPSLTNPADGETAASTLPLLRSTTFAVTSGSDTQNGSQWRIARDSGMTNLVYDSGTVTDTNQHQVPSGSVLAPQIDYYADVRHRGTNFGWSNRSAPITFRTQAQPDRPVITAPVDGSENVSRTTAITASPFSRPGGGSHAASQWQVSIQSNFAATVVDTGDDPANLTRYQIPAGRLANNTPYYARVRYKDSGGSYSAWSLVVAFRTLPQNAVNTNFAITRVVRTAVPSTDEFTQNYDSVTTGINLLSKSGAIFIKGDQSNGEQSGSYTYGGFFNTSRGTSDGNLIFRATGFDISTREYTGSPFMAYTLAQAEKFFKTNRFTSGTASLGGFSSVAHGMPSADAVGQVWIVPLNTVGQNYRLPTLVYDRGFTDPLREYMKWPRPTRSIRAVDPWFKLDDGTLQISQTLLGNTASYEAYIFAHDPDPVTGAIQCGSFVTDATGAGTYQTGWDNGVQFICIKCADDDGLRLIVETVQSPGFVGADRVQPLNNSGSSDAYGSANDGPALNYTADIVSQTGGAVRVFGQLPNRRYTIMAIRAAS